MVRLQPVLEPREESLWLQEAAARGERQSSPQLLGTHATEICIVGGGFTGLWTALRIKELEPARHVTLLEARECGSGASGRNGGMVGGWWLKLGTLIRVCGTDEARTLAEAAYSAIDEMEAFVATHNIDCHFVRNGRLQVATSRFQLDSWEPALQLAEEHGYGGFFTRLAREEIRQRSGSPVVHGGYFERGQATVQPALLAKGMRRVALQQGVEIFEHTPVTELLSGAPVALRVPGGLVVADKVVLATNAWTAALPELRRHMIVVSSDMVATEPVPDLLAESGWTGGESLADCRLMVHYGHVTHDKRIAIGRGSGALAYMGRITPAFDGVRTKADVVEQGLRKFYPQLGNTRITHRWGGPIDRTRSGTLAFGHLAGQPNVVYGIGYSGTGVGQTVLGGKILASTVLERDDFWRHTRLNKGPVILYPPDPVKFFAGLGVRAVLTRREEGEEDGIMPTPLIKRVSQFAYPTLPRGLDRSKSKKRV